MPYRVEHDKAATVHTLDEVAAYDLDQNRFAHPCIVARCGSGKIVTVKAVVQRADGATVEVAGERLGGFDGPGLCVLVGVTHTDTNAEAQRLAAKIWSLRLFEREHLADHVLARTDVEARELSASDLGLPVLVISQFTLYGNTDKGRRPTWNDAAPGDVAEPLVAAVVAELRALGAEVSTGRFGADMRVSLVNDGPFTVLLEV